MSVNSWYRPEVRVPRTNKHSNTADIDLESSALLNNNWEHQEMELVEVYDCNGDKMSLAEYRNCLWPRTMKFVDSVSELECRPDDVILCSYPRSGTHWVWQILWGLLKDDHSEDNPTKQDLMLEYQGCDQLKEIKFPRVINTHMKHSFLPPNVFRKKCKIVLVLRNPKDVVVSCYNFCTSRRHYVYEGQFPAFLDLFLEGVSMPYGSWFEYTAEWEKVIKNGSECPISVVYYEELKQDFGSTVRRLANSLGISRSDEFYRDLEIATSVDKLKESVKAGLSAAELSEWKGEPEFIRKGFCGEWKKRLTVKQNEQFDIVFNRYLKHSAFRFDLS